MQFLDLQGEVQKPMLMIHSRKSAGIPAPTFAVPIGMVTGTGPVQVPVNSF